MGVVVTGDPVLQGQVAARIEGWLKGHDFTVIPTPIDAEGFSTIGNCLLLDDLDCAQGVIETRATADAVAYVRIEAVDADIAVSAWWFVKGHDPTHDHAVCTGCKHDGWRDAADTVMVSITGANANLGHLKLRSRPSNVLARIDGKKIGPTPVELDVSSGDHVIVLERGGKRLARKPFTIASGETASIDIPVKPVAPPRPPREVSNAGQVIAIVAGGLAIVGGGYVIYYGHQANAAYDFPHATPIGIGLAGAGVGAVVAGIALYDHGPRRRRPVVSLTPSSAVVGWAADF